MTLLIGGAETGLQNTTLNLLGRNDQPNTATTDNGDQMFVNVASGNLIYSHQDTYLPSRGQDYQFLRTYNSRAGFAYRCLPLTAANSHGWELLCPVGFTARWRGGAAVAEVEVHSDAPLQASRSGADYLAFLLGGGESAPSSRPVEDTFPAGFAESQFGSGILTFNPLLIIRPPSGHDLWVSRPVNRFKDAIQPMSALIEADWMPFTFSMNWQITRADTTITFEKGEPFCSFFPVARGVVERCEPVLKPISDDPALQKSYWASRMTRNAAVAAGQGAESPFQGWYANRSFPGDAAPAESQPTPRAGKAKPFQP